MAQRDGNFERTVHHDVIVSTLALTFETLFTTYQRIYQPLSLGFWPKMPCCGSTSTIVVLRNYLWVQVAGRISAGQFGG